MLVCGGFAAVAQGPAVQSPVPGTKLELPIHTDVEVRLEKPIASYSAKKGDAVEAVVIAPVKKGDQILVPMGTKATGTLKFVRRVGIGFAHETAILDIDFTGLTFPDGETVAWHAQVAEIENARESVDKKGDVKGISATGSIAYRASGAVTFLAFSNPVGVMFAMAGSSAVLRFPDPEIVFPVGTEMLIRSEMVAEIPVAAAGSGEVVPPIAETGLQREQLEELIHGLPFRTFTGTRTGTRTGTSEIPSDLTNLVFVGNRDAIERAFQAAGWVASDPLSAETVYRTVRSITENQQYQTAPMSTLLLDGQAPQMAYSKTLNTFAKRHHLRIWRVKPEWDGNTVWTSSSTQDTGIGFSKKNKTFIHLIDTNIDNERAKIVNDLLFTGCVDAVQLVGRPWVPKDAKNGTGEELKTDGAIAVLELNECKDPEGVVDYSTDGVKTRGNRGQRATRQTMLTLKNNLLQQNVVVMGYSGVKYLVNRKKETPEQKAARQMDVGGEEYTIQSDKRANLSAGPRMSPGSWQPQTVGEAPPAPDRWKAPSVEIGLHGGDYRYSTDAFNFTSITIYPTLSPPTLFEFDSQLHAGWNAGISVTLNSYNHISNELNFDYDRGEFQLGIYGKNNQDADYFELQKDGLVTAQFSYNLLWNFTGKRSRWRPFVAVGPTFQMLHLTDAPFKKAPAYFSFGLKNVGIITAAYEYGTTPPLEGGGIFQPGLQYGAGVRYRIAPRWMARVDYRQTLTGQPDFWSKSLPHIQDLLEFDDPGWTASEATPVKKSGPLLAERLTGGISFTF
jgi:opacity protein-like surface antigen